MPPRIVTYVQKACAYITREDGQLLVFDGPEYERLQVPKGTLERTESPRAALEREVREETGLTALESVRHLTTDVWQRRASPPRWYVRHFFHARVDESRDRWTHTVTGEGDERGAEYECSWVDLPTHEAFALSLDDYVHLLDTTPKPSPPMG